MKLFMLFIINQAIAGSVGPLPGDVAECRTYAVEMRQQFLEGAKETNTPLSGDLSVACVALAERPALGASWTSSEGIVE